MHNEIFVKYAKCVSRKAFYEKKSTIDKTSFLKQFLKTYINILIFIFWNMKAEVNCQIIDVSFF